MRDYKLELENRIKFIKDILKDAHAQGIVYGNSGGKDSALAGILCKMACDNTLGVMMPCESKRNYEEDMADAIEVAKQFNIKTKVIDITEIKKLFVNELSKDFDLNSQATTNLNPRIRMTTLYAIGASNNMLVCGTGNRSEIYMGYFTKYGDGGCDFNPIADLTVRETYEFLEYLNAPKNIIKKAPSAALYEGQTDEKEMGVTYNAIDDFLLKGIVNKEDKKIIDSYHNKTKHKRKMPLKYK